MPKIDDMLSICIVEIARGIITCGPVALTREEDLGSGVESPGIVERWIESASRIGVLVGIEGKVVVEVVIGRLEGGGLE